MNKNGFTLVEILISIVIFLIFCIGIFNFFLYGQKEMNFSTHNYIATELADQKLEEIKTMAYKDIKNSNEEISVDNINYTRNVEVEKLNNPERKKVKVEVIWTEGGKNNKIKLETIISPR
ncbi:type II secretion system protein [bacterium]|nr:type II secretion system protein [bacterium]